MSTQNKQHEQERRRESQARARKPLSRKLLALLLSLALPLSGLAQEAAEPAPIQQVDRLELDSTAVTGNQELPRVLYIVPWKTSGIGELSGKPVNSLLDEVLAPIDREVFQRQVRYFEQIYGNESLAAAGE